MAKQKNDMTLKDAIFNLNEISKRTNEEEVIAKIGYAIADLEAYKHSKGGDFIIDEVIAEHIESKSSTIASSIDSFWASKLWNYIFEMTQGLSELRQLQSDAINVSNKTMDDFLQYHENKKKQKWFTFGVCALIFVAATLTLLSCFVESFMGWGSAVGAIIGLLDFALGLVFQVYERNDDMKRVTAAKEAKSELQNKTEKISQIAEKIYNFTGDNGTYNIYT